MRHIFKFPDIGEGISEGKILKWYIEKGEKIKSGDSVVKMETDKVVTDIPSPKTGTIVSVFGKEGDTINVGDALVEIEYEGKKSDEDSDTGKKKEEKSEQPEEKGFGVVGTLEVAGNSAYLPESDEGMQTEEEKPQRKKALATPVARKMAKDLGVDINQVNGTGPGGRVMKADIRKYYEGQQDETGSKEDNKDKFTYEDLSQIRKTIAKNMRVSKNNAVHMTVFEEIEISELIEIRNRQKEKLKEKGIKLTYLSFIVKAVTEALKEYPKLNSELDLSKNRMIYKNFYNIGIAADTEDGLVVPVVKGTDSMSVIDIAEKIAVLAEKAKSRKLNLEDYKDGTFSITNYGVIGGIWAVPVINYPQAAILGIGRIIEKPIVKNGEIVVGRMLPLSLTADHRIVDGAEAGRFLNKIMEYLNDPVGLLLK